MHWYIDKFYQEKDCQLNSIQSNLIWLDELLNTNLIRLQFDVYMSLK